MTTQPPKRRKTKPDHELSGAVERNQKQERFWQKIQEARGVTEENPKGKISERGFAPLIGVSNTAIQNIRKGWSDPSPEFQAKVANYIGWTYEQMHDWVEYGKEPSLDTVEQVLAALRRFYAPDLIKALDTISMRWADLEKIKPLSDQI